MTAIARRIKTKPTNTPPAPSRFKVYLKLASMLIIIIGASVGSYFLYLAYIDPKNIHGDWIEVGSPQYKTDIITFSEYGVSINQRIVSTRYEFDGTNIRFSTGKGEFLYKKQIGSFPSKLKKVLPKNPTQHFIKREKGQSISSSAHQSIKNKKSLSDIYK
ncbi:MULTISPECIES: DUF2850 domain-containing protein [Vibrio]|uniref:DUF2850 domain-containing protein n=1 Tax=Vibrio TaxID=662 RepID=UPI00142EAA2D|nr:MULTISPECIES: DUF2850 domain-containing protein [Vibrio]